MQINRVSSIFRARSFSPLSLLYQVEDPSSSSARFALKFRRNACSLSKPHRCRPDGSEDQRSKGKAPREPADERRKKGERDRRPSGYRWGSRVGFCPSSGHFPRYAFDARDEATHVSPSSRSPSSSSDKNRTTARESAARKFIRKLRCFCRLNSDISGSQSKWRLERSRGISLSF